MSRQELHAPVGTCPQLDTRTAQLLADNALLDDAAILLELGHVRLKWHLRRLQLHGPHPSTDRRTSRAVGNFGDSNQVDQGVASTRDAFVGLDDHLADRWSDREHV